MSTDSLRQTIEAAYPDADVSAGLLNWFRSSQPLYQHRPADLFPVRSLRELARSLRWPRRLKKVAEHPKDVDTGWSDNLQGVCCSSTHWFFSE